MATMSNLLWKVCYFSKYCYQQVHWLLPWYPGYLYWQISLFSNPKMLRRMTGE
jgi:hypothetical protein